MQKLALTVAHGTGETPSSFASRVAARNFISARELSRDFELSFQKIVDGDRGAIQRLAELAGADVGTLMSNAIVKTGTTFELRGQQISKPLIRRARVHVCPVCIQEDIAASGLPPGLAAFGRLEWAIASIRTCARHSVALVEVRDDLKPGELHDFTRNIADTLPSIGRMADKAQRRPASGLETYLLGRIEGCSDCQWLDSLAFFAAAWTTEIVGAVAAFGKRVNMDTLSEDDRYKAGTAGFEIVKDGMDGLERFMSKLKREHVPKKDGSADGPQATFGKLHMTFAQGLVDPGYDPVRAVMAEHILDNFPLGPGDELFGKPVEVRRFHSVRTAALTYKMHPKRLRKLIDAQGLLPDPTIKDRDVLFDADIADRLFKREADSLSMKEVEKYINAPRPMAQILFQAGLIRRHVTGIGRMNEVFFKSELDEFLERLFQKAETVPESAPGLCDVATAAKRTNASTADYVRLVLEDRLAWVGRKAGTEGVLALLVNLEEARPLIRLPELSGLVPADAIKELRVSDPVIRSLLKVGALKTIVERHPIKRNPQVVIPHEEIERFKMEFASLFLLARERGKHMPVLLRELQALGIQPAAELKGVGATFFRRSDLPS
jgi:hypothetical protein